MIDAPSLRWGAGRLHGEEHRRDIGPDNGFKGLECGGSDRRIAGDAGIGEQDVELAEFFDRALDRLFGRRDIGGVGDQRERVRSQFLRRGLERRLISPG